MLSFKAWNPKYGCSIMVFELMPIHLCFAGCWMAIPPLSPRFSMSFLMPLCVFSTMLPFHDFLTDALTQNKCYLVRQVWKKWHPPTLDAADVRMQKIHELIMAKMCSRLLAD